MSYDVFISYAHHDKSLADTICAELELRGITCWIAPRNVQPGCDYADEIVIAINECSSMVLVFSAEANKSREIASEVYLAFTKAKPIVVFRIEDVKPQGAMEYRLGKTHWLDAMEPPLEVRIGELVSSVANLLGRPVKVDESPEAAPPKHLDTSKSKSPDGPLREKVSETAAPIHSIRTPSRCLVTISFAFCAVAFCGLFLTKLGRQNLLHDNPANAAPNGVPRDVSTGPISNPPVSAGIVPIIAPGPVTVSQATGGALLTGPTLPKTANARDEWINPKDDAEMIYISARHFLMGDNNQKDNPRHEVTLSGYWIYKDLVTVKRYRTFCENTGRQMPPEPEYPKGNRFNPGWSRLNDPIVNVTWYDALAYSRWANVALPTEAQCEKAARGVDGATYPWGNTFDSAMVWAGTRTNGNAEGTHGVGLLGRSKYSNCSDMVGNVFQWCADWYDAGFTKGKQAVTVDPLNETVGEQKLRALRGNPWFDTDPTNLVASHRGSADPDKRFSYVGFRCAAGK